MHGVLKMIGYNTRMKALDEMCYHMLQLTSERDYFILHILRVIIIF